MGVGTMTDRVTRSLMHLLARSSVHTAHQPTVAFVFAFARAIILIALVFALVLLVLLVVPLATLPPHRSPSPPPPHLHRSRPRLRPRPRPRPPLSHPLRPRAPPRRTPHRPPLCIRNHPARLLVFALALAIVFILIVGLVPRRRSPPPPRLRHCLRPRPMLRSIRRSTCADNCEPVLAYISCCKTCVLVLSAEELAHDK